VSRRAIAFIVAVVSVCATLGLFALACGIDATLLSTAPTFDAATTVDAYKFDGISAADASGVFAGQYSACALSHGSPSCWGDNTQSDLGTGDEEMHVSPTSVDTTARFTLLAPGQSHVCAIRAPDARVMCWGDNTYGQIGIGGSATSYASPQGVTLPGPAVWVTAGYEHSCAVLYDGSLWCWGDNSEGQLGLNDAYGSPNATKPVRVGSAVDWVTVSGGQGHTCGVRAPGTMWCWGRNTNYELGIGTSAPDQLRAPTQVGMSTNWTFVELGQDDACALQANGSLWGWGAGTSGQLGTPAGVFETPSQIGTDTNWTTVSTDTFSSCAIQSGGALYCWGRNVEGQLGTGDTNDRTVPTLTGSNGMFGSVSVGRFFTCAENLSLQVSCTGANESGQLGVGDTMRRDLFTPVSLPESQ
jgi:alpha-tubulin suppressor-like RCC1 family protein